MWLFDFLAIALTIGAILANLFESRAQLHWGAGKALSDACLLFATFAAIFMFAVYIYPNAQTAITPAPDPTGIVRATQLHLFLPSFAISLIGAGVSYWIRKSRMNKA